MYSILMPTYQIPEYLKLCVDSILENSYYKTHQLCIHVNGYDKESMYYLDSKNVKYIVTEEIGAPEAINICIDQAKCDTSIITNDDCYFTKNWDYYLHQWEIEMNNKFPDYVKFIGYRWCEPNPGSCPPICNAGKNIKEFNVDKLNEYISKNSVHDIGNWYFSCTFPTDILTKCKFSPEFSPKGNEADFGLKILNYLKENNKKFLIFGVRDCYIYHFQRVASTKHRPSGDTAYPSLFKQKWNMSIQDAYNLLNNEVKRSVYLLNNYQDNNHNSKNIISADANKEVTTQFIFVKMVVNENDTTGKIIINGGIPEENAFREFIKYVKKDSIIVDIGACYGQYALICAKIAPNGIVIAIEPNPYHFNLLKKGIEINNIKNIIPLNVALSDYEGESKLFMCNNHLEGATLFEGKLKQELDRDPDKEINIYVTTLDQILDKLHIDHNNINIIKMDAEGAEPKIIKGMIKVLQQSKDLKLLTEYAFHAISASGENGKDFMEYLINRFSEVKMITEDKNMRVKILNKDNIGTYSNTVCTSLFCK